MYVSVAYLRYGRQGTCHGRHWQGAAFGLAHSCQCQNKLIKKNFKHFKIDTFLLILTYVYILVYIKKCMSLKPNKKEINIILNILKGAQFYIDTPLVCMYLQKLDLFPKRPVFLVII
jgi:hypothetical protein